MKIAVTALAFALLTLPAAAQDVRLIDPSDPEYRKDPPPIGRKEALEIVDKYNPGMRKRAREMFRQERAKRGSFPTPIELDGERCDADAGAAC